MQPSELTNFLLVFARVGAMLAMFPVFSAVNVPVRVRVGLAAVIGYVVSVTVPVVEVRSLGWGGLLVLAAQEIGSGLLLGFISRLAFHALEATGSVIARELGFQMASELNPFTQASVEVPALILHFLALMLLFALDLHHWLLLGIQRSYEFLPAGRAQLNAALVPDLVTRTGRLFTIAIQIAAPVIAVSLLVNVIFAILGRAVQQMNVFTESFSFRALAGLATFGLTLQLMSEHITNYLRRLPEDVLRVAVLLNGR